MTELKRRATSAVVWSVALVGVVIACFQADIPSAVSKKDRLAP